MKTLREKISKKALLPEFNIWQIILLVYKVKQEANGTTNCEADNILCPYIIKAPEGKILRCNRNCLVKHQN